MKDREKCQYFTKKNQCLHPKMKCDFLIEEYLCTPACSKKSQYVFPDVNCVGCESRFAECCVEKCPEERGK